MSHFYVTLPSDSSANYFPNNTVARFITQLPERIHLEGEYEMALAEIIYPHTWYNVDNQDEKYWLAAIGVGRDNILRVDLPSGYYADGSAVATVLNREFSRSAPNVKVEFTYNEVIIDLLCRFSRLVRRYLECQRTYNVTWVSISVVPSPPILKLSRRWLNGHSTRIADCISCTSIATLQHTRSSATLKLPCCGSATFPVITATRSERRSFIRITCRSDVANSTRFKSL
jgi:hypothetical protein